MSITIPTSMEIASRMVAIRAELAELRRLYRLAEAAEAARKAAGHRAKRSVKTRSKGVVHVAAG